MKRIYTLGIHLVTCLLVYTPQASAILFIRGNGTSVGQTFLNPVQSKTFDRPTGTIYVGLSGSNNGNFSVATMNRNTTIGATFQAIGSTRTSSGTSAANTFLTTASSLGVPAKILAGVDSLSTTKAVFALTTDGTISKNSAELLDASGALNTNGAVNNGISALAANSQFIFASVAPNGGAFGANNSGVVVVSIVFDTSTGTPTLASLVQTAAVAGDSGIKAQKVDPTTAQVRIQNNVTIESSPTTLTWDDTLRRLYIGLNLASGALAGDGARSIVVARVNAQGVLDLSAAAPDSAVTSSTAANQSEIVVTRHSDATATNLGLHHVQVMHASTGPSYLIVNGGNGTASETGNIIFALPLVDLRNGDGTLDPIAEADHGTLANKNAPLVNFRYVVPATAAGELVQDPLRGGTDVFALVGGSALPSQVETAPADMVVVGDTVYVAFNTVQSPMQESGVLYSQAKFDETGKIVGWTPWSKRGFPFRGLPGTMNPDSIKFVDVDAVTGNVWAIGADSAQTVGITSWDLGNNATALATQLNVGLKCGAYSVLDLDAMTRGFNEATGFRYALFGGCNKVMMALISTALSGTSAPSSFDPQEVTEDFTNPENLLTTGLPTNAGSVTVLEYARRLSTDPTDENFFFAGTETGLYVFALSGGAGFPASALATLDLAPFTTGHWSKAPNITGAIIDIKTLGNSLYVLTFNTTRTQPLSNTLYRIDFGATINTMFTPANIHVLAQTRADSFANMRQFTGIQLIATADDSSTEQLVLATNKGIFKSSTVAGVQAATSDATAAWAEVPNDNAAFYTGIAGMDPGEARVMVGTDFFSIGSPQTVWPMLMQNATLANTLERSSISQLNGTTDIGTFEFVPQPFNGNVTTPNFATLPTIINFWTDGARRFFIIQRPEDSGFVNKLMVSPYNAQEWAVSNPAQNIVASPTFDALSSFNWVKQIGASGILLAGTNNGVVALE
jgi:hypothetical protein